MDGMHEHRLAVLWPDVYPRLLRVMDADPMLQDRIVAAASVANEHGNHPGGSGWTAGSLIRASDLAHPRRRPEPSPQQWAEYDAAAKDFNTVTSIFRPGFVGQADPSETIEELAATARTGWWCTAELIGGWATRPLPLPDMCYAAAAAGNVHIRDLIVESLASVEEDLVRWVTRRVRRRAFYAEGTDALGVSPTLSQQRHRNSFKVILAAVVADSLFCTVRFEGADESGFQDTGARSLLPAPAAGFRLSAPVGAHADRPDTDPAIDADDFGAAGCSRDGWRARGGLAQARRPGQQLKIVADRKLGTVFVSVDGRLHPALNLVSAWLIAGDPAEPTFVSPDDLAKWPRGPLVGIEGAPTEPPRVFTPEVSRWAVCDTASESMSGVP